ncbi:MAG TPA: fused MFS/spermidine synthase [Anaerolineales bacterium]|nr:fused MFS/spermidine synthase [Anaerolineales bacterium]
MSLRLLYITVFVSGMTTLAVELTASHLLAPVFGSSTLVWASIIGLILIYLTAGYFLGGRWADRSPYPRTFFGILAWGAFTAGLVPLLAKPVLPFAATAFDTLDFGVLAGSFLGVLVLFIVPITLLGCISPFAIRLAVKRTSEAGTIAGRIYAISTLGSFIGTFLPVLILIPLVGVAATFLIFSLTLLILALVGLGYTSSPRAALTLSWMPLALIALYLLVGRLPIKTTEGQVYETQSAYNYIEVLESNGFTLLRLNEGQGIHSIYHPTELFYGGPWEQVLPAPFFNADFNPDQVRALGIIGLAGGTTARQATAVFGPIPIDGWEIDPAIIEVGRKYFGMTLPNLNALAEDGRWGLAHSDRLYTIISVDAYRVPYIPPHLTTQEFFQTVYNHLTPGGAMTINVGRAPNDRRLVDGLVGTISTIFPSVYVMDIPATFNSIVYATKQPTTFDNFTANLARLLADPTVHPLLLRAMTVLAENLQPTPDSQTVFTDDHTPIEWLTNGLVLSFILSGGTEDLK